MKANGTFDLILFSYIQLYNLENARFIFLLLTSFSKSVGYYRPPPLPVQSKLAQTSQLYRQ